MIDWHEPHLKQYQISCDLKKTQQHRIRDLGLRKPNLKLKKSRVEAGKNLRYLEISGCLLLKGYNKVNIRASELLKNSRNYEGIETKNRKNTCEPRNEQSSYPRLKPIRIEGNAINLQNVFSVSF